MNVPGAMTVGIAPEGHGFARGIYRNGRFVVDFNLANGPLPNEDHNHQRSVISPTTVPLRSGASEFDYPRKAFERVRQSVAEAIQALAEIRDQLEEDAFKRLYG